MSSYLIHKWHHVTELFGLCSSVRFAFVSPSPVPSAPLLLATPRSACGESLASGTQQPSRSKVATRVGPGGRLRVRCGRQHNGWLALASTEHRFGFHSRCRLPAAAAAAVAVAAAEWWAGLMTFDPFAYDSTPEPSVALLAQHQLHQHETYSVRLLPARSFRRPTSNLRSQFLSRHRCRSQTATPYALNAFIRLCIVNRK